MRPHRSLLARYGRAAFVVLTAVAAGCGSGAGSSLEGTWSGRCSHDTGPNTTLTTRFDDKGHYSSSSNGTDGETAGTYAVTAPDTVTITNQAATHAYHYQVNNNVLTLTTNTTQGHSETCNLSKQ